MKSSKLSEEQILYAFRQAETGAPVGDLCRQLGVSEATFYAWKKKYARLSVIEPAQEVLNAYVFESLDQVREISAE